LSIFDVCCQYHSSRNLFILTLFLLFWKGIADCRFHPCLDYIVRVRFDPSAPFVTGIGVEPAIGSLPEM
jgi:hypothetical protein